jgi:hypothetical protein
MATVTDLLLAQEIFGRPRHWTGGALGWADESGFQNPIPGRAWDSTQSNANGIALANALTQYPADTYSSIPAMDASSVPPEPRWPDLPRRDIKYGGEVSPMITGLQAEQTPLEQRVRYLPPPPRPQRPFTEDYPSSYFLHPFPWRYLWGAPTDFQGRLRYDSERRELQAKYVAGRRYANRPDVGLQHHEVMDVLKQLGHPPRFLPTNQMPGADRKGQPPAGTTGVHENTWPWSWVEGKFRPGEVSIDAGLAPRYEHIAASHELGHVLRFLTRLPMSDAAQRELRALFNTMNNPNRTPDGLNAAPSNVVTPETFGYSTQSALAGLNPAEEEYFAEAFRAYMTDPNFLKSVAPNLAAAIRDAVNSHPRLRRVIQFNSLKYPTYAGLMQYSDQAGTGSS